MSYDDEDGVFTRRGQRPHPLDLSAPREREGIFANQLPSAPKDHTPRMDDYPRGWTAQQPWHHPAYAMPQVRCTLCGRSHPIRSCEVSEVLVSLPAIS